MECIVLDYMDNDYGNDLLSHLRDKVLHMTTQDGYKSIRKDGYIYANTKGKYPAASGHSECYGNCHGLVCLFDLRGKTEQELNDFSLTHLLFKMGGSRQPQKSTVYLILAPTAYNSIICNEDGPVPSEKPCDFHIPKYECWFPEKIPLDCIKTALCVKVTIPTPQDP